MKRITIICALSTIVAATACHKKTEAPAPAHVVNNTDGQANVATAIDSGAVASQYKVDMFQGRFTDLDDGNYGSMDTSEMSFSISHITNALAIFKCSGQVQIDDIQWRGVGTTGSIYDTVTFVGKGSYHAGRITFRLDGTEVGDSLHVSWLYENNNHPSDADHICDFEGVRVK